jgi:hypothetical protein
MNRKRLNDLDDFGFYLAIMFSTLVIALGAVAVLGKLFQMIVN